METDADYIDDATEAIEFRVINGGSQRGRDLLVESVQYSYNVSISLTGIIADTHDKICE